MVTFDYTTLRNYPHTLPQIWLAYGGIDSIFIK